MRVQFYLKINKNKITIFGIVLMEIDTGILHSSCSSKLFNQFFRNTFQRLVNLSVNSTMLKFSKKE